MDKALLLLIQNLAVRMVEIEPTDPADESEDFQLLWDAIRDEVEAVAPGAIDLALDAAKGI